MTEKQRLREFFLFFLFEAFKMQSKRLLRSFKAFRCLFSEMQSEELVICLVI